MAVLPSNSLVDNWMEADKLTTVNRSAAADAEVAFYPNNASLAALKVDLDILDGTVAGGATGETAEQQLYVQAHDGLAATLP